MLIARRGFATAKVAKAAQAAVAPAAARSPAKDNSHVARSTSSGYTAIVKEELKVTRLPNDLFVASEDSGFPLARISVAVKAGSRHEPAELPGLSHVLRNAAPLATKQCTAFGLSRNLEQLGANLLAITTRDLTVYSLEVTRNNLHDAMKFLSYVVTQQEFKAWEILDARERLLVDLAILKKHPEIRLVENLHKAAYSGGLANSLYAPEFAVKHIKGDMLSEYARRVFLPNRVAIAGGNVGHEELRHLAEKYFKFDHVGQQTGDLVLTSKIAGVEQHHYKIDASNTNEKPARYVGGEIREDTCDHLAYAAFVTEGPGLNNPKDLITMKLVQQVIGVEPHVKWSTGQNTSELVKAASEVTKNPFAVSGVSFCHSDSSLSGFSVVAHAKDLPNILKAGLDVLRGKSGVDEKRLQAAKTRLISSIMMTHESSGESVLDSAMQALASGSVLSPFDAVKIVEKVALSDIVALAKKSLGTKPTLAAVGNLSHCPRLEELVGK